MAISPYSVARPVNFEYKPMGLEAFAKPLSAMQEKYDKASEDIEKLPKMFNTLEADDPRRLEIEKSIQESNDKLKEEFLRTGNYKQAQRDILKLQQKFNTDPEKLAAEGNLKRWQEYDKEQLKRVEKGEVKRDYYLIDKQRKLKSFSDLKGTNFKEGDYNNIGTTALLNDEEDNIRKEAIDLAKMSPEKIVETLGTYKELDGGFRKELVDKLTKSKSADEMQREIYNVLLTSDKYKYYAREVGDLKSYSLKENSPEQYKELKKEFETSLKKEITEEEFDKLYKDSVAQQIFNTRPIAELAEYNNKTYERSGYNPNIRSMDGYDGDGKLLPEQTINPLVDIILTPETIEKQKINSTKNSVNFTQTLKTNGQSNLLLNNTRWYEGPNDKFLYRTNTDGSVEAKPKIGGKPFKLEKPQADNAKDHILESISKNPDRVYQRTNNVLRAYDRNSENIDGFVKELSKQGISAIDAKTQWYKLQDKNTYETLNSSLGQIEQDANNYNLANEADKLLNNKLKQSPAYKEFEKQIKNSLINGGNQSIFGADKYSDKQLSRIGLKRSDIHGTSLTGKDVAKMLGYSSFDEAYEKGAFKSVVLKGRIDNIDPLVYKELGIDNPQDFWSLANSTELGKIQKSIKSAYAKTGKAQTNMVFTIDGDEKLNKRVTNLGSTEFMAGTFDPITGSWASFKGNKGSEFFDKEGNPLEDVVRDVKADRVGVLPAINQGGLIWGYKNTKTGETTSVMVKPKKRTSKNINTEYGLIVETGSRNRNPEIANAFKSVEYKNFNPTGVLKEEDIPLLANSKNSKGKVENTFVSSIPYLDQAEIIIKKLPITDNISKPKYQLYLKIKGTNSEQAIGDRTESLLDAQIKSVNIAKGYK